MGYILVFYVWFDQGVGWIGLFTSSTILIETKKKEIVRGFPSVKVQGIMCGWHSTLTPHKVVSYLKHIWWRLLHILLLPRALWCVMNIIAPHEYIYKSYGLIVTLIIWNILDDHFIFSWHRIFVTLLVWDWKAHVCRMLSNEMINLLLAVRY